MAAAGEGAFTTAKATKSDAPSGPTMKDQQKQPPAVLEEDDEFEDFPVDDWPASEQEVPPGRETGREQEGAGGQHLWEESWDDDDTNEEFSKQLKAELDKVKRQK